MVVGNAVRLRSVTSLDLPRFLRWFNDPAVVRFLDLELPLTEENEREWIANLSKRPDLLVLVIERLSDGKAIGTIGLSAIDRRHGTAELGLTIGEVGEWGKGYGTDAVRSMIKVAFGTVGVRKLRLSVQADHAAALRLYERCGFRREGVLRQAHFHDGQYHDIHVMGILQGEFQDE